MKYVKSIIWIFCALTWVFSTGVQLYLKNFEFAVFYGVIALINFAVAYVKWPKKELRAPNNPIS